MPKYSDMLMQLVNQFEAFLPTMMTFEDVLQVGIDAWNLANNNNDLEDDRYKDALKKFENSEVINQMAYYKVQNFPEFNNFIVDFEIKDEILHVKSQSFEDYFMNVVSSMMDVRSK